MASRTYPSDSANTALALFERWFGAHYARSLERMSFVSANGAATARLRVGQKWDVAAAVVDTLAADASIEFEAARAAVERRLDSAGRPVVLWVPRDAPLPSSEPGLSRLALALEQALELEDGRLEVRQPVTLHLRRTSTTGSVITVLGGLSAHWAQFTNRVPGSFQLNSSALHRLPASAEDRDALAERIVSACQQPDVDDSLTLSAEDAWTANALDEGGSSVLGSPRAETDEQNAALRRNLRRLLRETGGVLSGSGVAKALIVLGAATYAEEEKLSWALRGMDPALYAGYDLICVVADGVVKPLLEPARNTLPWDAPLRAS